MPNQYSSQNKSSSGRDSESRSASGRSSSGGQFEKGSQRAREAGAKGGRNSH